MLLVIRVVQNRVLRTPSTTETILSRVHLGCTSCVHLVTGTRRDRNQATPPAAVVFQKCRSVQTRGDILRLARVEKVMMTHAPTLPASDVDRDARERALLRAARRGDQDAVHALCVALRPRLYKTALAVLGDASSADDVAQEALVRALSKLTLFGTRGSVGGWMSRIALNLAKNKLRDAATRMAREADAMTHADNGAVPRTPSSLLASAAVRQNVLDALHALPPRQRDVAALRLLGELPFAEIAETLAIKDGAARMAFQKARLKLQDALAADAPTQGGQT